MNYTGCLLVVSHDRYFMDKLVDHLFVLDGEGGIKDFNGRYSDYRISLDEKEKAEAKLKNKLTENKSSDSVKTEVVVKKKVSFKEKFEYETLDKEIASLENERAELTVKMSSGESDHLLLQKWSKRMEEIIKIVEEKSVRWLELSELM